MLSQVKLLSYQFYTRSSTINILCLKVANEYEMKTAKKIQTLLKNIDLIRALNC